MSAKIIPFPSGRTPRQRTFQPFTHDAVAVVPEPVLPVVSRSHNEALRRERELRGWSQRRVAEQLDTTEDVISRWGRGERKPSPHYREKLCVLFGLTADQLGFIER